MRALIPSLIMLTACGTSREPLPLRNVAAPTVVELPEIVEHVKLDPPTEAIDQTLPAPCAEMKADPHHFQFVDDVCHTKRMPRDEDRDFACPNPWTSDEVVTSEHVGFYRPSSEGVTWDTESLRKYVPDDVQVTVISIRRIDGVPHFRYLSNGSHNTAFQPWSSSKFIAIASAASSMRERSKGAVGLDATVDLVPVGDLVTAVHTYDEKHYTSNALARWFVDVSGRTRINELVHDWLGREDESLGGGYGPGFVGLGLTFHTGKSEVTMPRDPQGNYENRLSTFTLAEALKRLVLHREEPNTRLPHATWTDVRTLLYGADSSHWYTDVGGMSADRAVYLQTAADIDSVAAKAKERFRIFSKTGMGWAQYVTASYGCFPALDDAGDPIVNQGHELVISVHYDGPGGYVINDRVIARVHRSVIQALLRDRA